MKTAVINGITVATEADRSLYQMPAHYTDRHLKEGLMREVRNMLFGGGE